MRRRPGQTPKVRKTFAAISASLFVSLCAVPAASASESRYTALDTSACTTLSIEDGMGSSQKCTGLEGLPVYVKEGDLRLSVFYGTVPQSYIDEGFETFSPFNTIGTKIEWRIDADGRTKAAILRWFLDNISPETGEVDPKRRGQVLVISRVAAGKGEKGCMVGFVDALANADANQLARDTADALAADFRCGVDTPAYHGLRGETAGEPSRHLPE